jgi:peptidoglycan hydrolase CwlO-like protein
MTLLGKLLLFFNLLAAGAFLYFATQDWKGRQTISAAGLRYQLYITGLPVEGPDTFDAEDETPFRTELSGSVSTETVSKKIIELYLQQAPGGDILGGQGAQGVVPSQMAEVKRVRARIDALLKEKSDDKVQLLHDLLILQSGSLDERIAVQTLAKDANAPELEKRLNVLFDSILAPASASTPDELEALPDLPKLTADLNALKASKAGDLAIEAKQKEVNEAEKAIIARRQKVRDARLVPLDSSERQIRIAHLLVHLNADAAWQKRVAMIVGLKQYINAIVLQTARFQNMAAELEKLILTDQKGYLNQDADLNKLARARTELSEKQSKLKAAYVEQKKKDDDLLNHRQTQLADISNQLDKVKAEVTEALAKQTPKEAELFEIQREVAITLEDVYRLEAELQARERALVKRDEDKNEKR